ncbi:hypothetical protein BV25DRAFT_1809161 [Artomyces pyxidatus]|uniref:Uncharacterized protein n=1 Tax=Artomyces pyxidatus TaxID=48021 RepID=A0ACB8STY5_9AGAM|nr:hypothetical protein BV25DRAFT_1809161 [Artomyces pyxidatus]
MYSNDAANEQNAHGHHVPVNPSHQSEELYKRSVMLVIWYKAHTTPLRFLHPLPTFPFLQLSHFPSLLTNLSLNQTSFIDTYNPVTGQWEQHMIDTVRLVETEQRVLYRLRKSLLDGLSEDECPGIQDEVAAQPRGEQIQSHRRFSTSSLKRPATESSHDASPPSKYYASENMYRASPPHPPQVQQFSVPVTQPQSYPQNLSAPKHGAQGQAVPIHANGNSPPAQPPRKPTPAASQPFIYQNTDLYSPVQSPPPPAPAPTAPLPPQSSAPIPYHPHPPLKRWPNDYMVSEVAAGFKQMDALVASMPTLTQRLAFERVFGCRYVKSTVCRHRGVWRRAGEDVRAAFESMGRDERAVWGEFVRRVEGRVSGVHGAGMDGMVQVAGLGPPEMGHMQGVMQVQILPHMHMRREEEETAEEAVMGSLGPPPEEHREHQAQGGVGMNGPPPPQGDGGHNGMQQQSGTSLHA